MATITKTTCYKTPDGEMFDNPTSANLHVTALELMEVFMTQGYRNDGTLKAMCFTMAKSFDKFGPVLTKLRTHATNASKVKKS